MPALFSDGRILACHAPFGKQKLSIINFLINATFAKKKLANRQLNLMFLFLFGQRVREGEFVLDFDVCVFVEFELA